ncbi:MAG: hypothetical protein RSG59_01260 [Ruthenibacterium sp.]
MKAILKFIFTILAILSAIVGLALWQKKSRPEYIEIYSDDDDDLF